MAEVVEALFRSAELERQRDELMSRLQTSVVELQGANQQLQASEGSLKNMVDERTRELTLSNEELREANRKLREMAVRDGLTGLFNHRCLVEHIELEVARSRRYDRKFSLVFLDLDDFKHINDGFGHASGDRVLVRVAELLKPSLDGLRHSDFAARYGGEEFCLILPETGVEGGTIKAERIRRSVEALKWDDVGGTAHGSITVSVGVAAFPDHGATMTAVLHAADAALYQAKAKGKNRVCVAQATSSSSAPGPARTG